MIKNYILADNQELTRYSLEHLIRQNEENVIHICSDKRDLMQLLEKHENSIVLLDYSLFNFVDEEQLLIFSERFSMTSWILVSEELTIKFIRKVLYSSHAFSIVLKDCGLRDFREALKSVSQGQRYICQQVMEILLTQQQQEETPDVLTSTELEIADSHRAFFQRSHHHHPSEEHIPKTACEHRSRIAPLRHAFRLDQRLRVHHLNHPVIHLNHSSFISEPV